MVRYHTYLGEYYEVETQEDNVFTFALVQSKTGKVKRTFFVKKNDESFVCTGRRCKRKECRHIQMVNVILERKPMEEGRVSEDFDIQTQRVLKVVDEHFSTYAKSGDFESRTLAVVKDDQEEAFIRLKDLIEELDFAATVAQREIEDKIEKTLILARDQVRERTLSEYIHVLQSNRGLMRERHLQCERCIDHNACVRSDRQGFKCLTYFLCLDYANEMEWYQSIPLDNEVLCTVDFQSLLILSSIHRVNFDTITDFSLEGLRDRLLELDKSSQYLLTI